MLFIEDVFSFFDSSPISSAFFLSYSNLPLETCFDRGQHYLSPVFCSSSTKSGVSLDSSSFFFPSVEPLPCTMTFSKLSHRQSSNNRCFSFCSQDQHTLLVFALLSDFVALSPPSLLLPPLLHLLSAIHFSTCSHVHGVSPRSTNLRF